MKKLLACIALILSVCMLAACGAKEAAPAEKVSAPAEEAAQTEVTVDYGTSDLYTTQEMDAVIELIKARFAEMTGCELHTVTYYGDDCNSADNIAWLNELEYGKGVTQAIAFKTDFRSPTDAEGTAWEPDMEYTDYEWWFGRTEGGDWTYISSGY